MKTIIITPPKTIADETVICNLLFTHGLERLHLRKPGAAAKVYEQFIQKIDPRYRNRIVIHDHYELAERYQLHGIHLHAGTGEAYPTETAYGSVSVSCHEVEEIRNLPFQASYCFLSPIFDSISKPEYRSAFPSLPDLSNIDLPVIALGGITPEHCDACRQAGFAGVAALGYIWGNPKEALKHFIRLRTPYVMTIAGFDPSGGAGITSDVKTFETTGSYGLSSCTGITFQNESDYRSTHWLPLEEIQRQCELPFILHRPEYVKIGLVENFDRLDRLIDYLHAQIPDVKIIWDPICKASAGCLFHTGGPEQLISILKRIYLLTPNSEEVVQLFGRAATVDSLQQLCREHQFNLLWKGGHDAGPYSWDRLITPEKIYRYPIVRSPYSKHGTGCVLSAALTSYLAQGDSLNKACNKAQQYVSEFIDSNDSKLGYHTLALKTLPGKPSLEGINLQYITAPKAGVSLGEQTEAVCQGGMRWVQLRMKGTGIPELLAEGKEIKEICQKYNTLLIINDDVQIARQLDADGVHLGKEDMDPLEAREILGSEKIIGATCNTWEDILLRHRQKVDYIGLGPFAFTTTKEKLSPVLGLDGYRRLLQLMRDNQIDIPVFAIGGITEPDILPLMQTGIRGIALSGLIKNSDDLRSKTREILKILE